MRQFIFKFWILTMIVLPTVSQATSIDYDMKFETKKIKLGNNVILVEIADNDQRRARGLMFRQSLPENQGMLFVFNEPEKLGFWMKNTLIPLAIGYFDKNKALIEVHEMVPASPLELHPKSYPSSKPAKYALEMNKGWFKKKSIKPGTKFEFVK